MSDEKVILITGASSDIGSMLADKIARNYSSVVVHYRKSKDNIDALCKKYGEKIIPVYADFSDESSTLSMIDYLKEKNLYPDHIVHLPAEQISNIHFHKMTWGDYNRQIDISLRSIVMICQQFIPNMSKKKYGKVLFLLTSYLFGLPPKYESSYITVKYALLGFMKSLAAEYAPKGITVNAVSPDMMTTKFLSNIPDIIKEQNAFNSPIGRNLIVEDVIPTMEYLLSNASDVVTGQNIGVTAGAR